MQAHVAAANRAVLAVGAMILAHMAMNRGGGGNAEQNGAKLMGAAGMAWQRWAGKAWHDKAAVANSRQMIDRHRP